MRKIRISYLLVIYLFFTLNLSGQSNKSHGLLIEEGFESGINPYTVSGNPAEVIRTANARAGHYVMKSQINNKRKVSYRTEASIRNDGLMFKPGNEYWVGLSTMLDTDFIFPSPFNDQGMLFQWHYFSWLRPEVPDAQPLVFRHVEGKVHIQCEMLDGYLASVPAQTGEWMDWIIHVKFDDKDGYFQVWSNGVKVVDWSGDNHQVEMVEGAYMKFGLYSAQFNPKNENYLTMPNGSSRTVYHDELRIAGPKGSFKAVSPYN